MNGSLGGGLMRRDSMTSLRSSRIAESGLDDFGLESGLQVPYCLAILVSLSNKRMLSSIILFSFFFLDACHVPHSAGSCSAVSCWLVLSKPLLSVHHARILHQEHHWQLRKGHDPHPRI